MAALTVGPPGTYVSSWFAEYLEHAAAEREREARAKADGLEFSPRETLINARSPRLHPFAQILTDARPTDFQHTSR